MRTIPSPYNNLTVMFAQLVEPGASDHTSAISDRPQKSFTRMIIRIYSRWYLYILLRLNISFSPSIPWRMMSSTFEFPRKRTTATTVKPPLLATLKGRCPVFMYCHKVRSNATCPLPSGPPRALYTGIGVDPMPVESRVATDASEGFDTIRATIRAHTSALGFNWA
jgi:hypothetical protein